MRTQKVDLLIVIILLYVLIGLMAFTLAKAIQANNKLDHINCMINGNSAVQATLKNGRFTVNC